MEKNDCDKIRGKVKESKKPEDSKSVPGICKGCPDVCWYFCEICWICQTCIS